MKKLLLSLLLCVATISPAQIIHRLQSDRFTHYQADDWVSYAPATVITSIDIGDTYIYFGTRSGGILRFQFYDRYWDYPLTNSCGLRDNHIRQIVFNGDTHQLFAQTEKGIDVYNTAFGYFQRSASSEMPQARIPSDEEIKNFQNSHSFRFPEFFRPANNELPDFFTQRDFLFRAPDEILDPYNRAFHLNGDRIADKFGNIWLATDGLGVAFSEFGSWNLKLYQQSLPNIAPKDLFLDKDGVWIGGSGLGPEPTGITFWNDSLGLWRYYEARYLTDISSDNVKCITGNRRYVFFGTDQGLQRYDKKDQSWNALVSYASLRSAQINDLKIVRDRLYIATDRGLYWMFPSSSNIERITDSKINNLAVYQIAATDGGVLLSTVYGLYYYDRKKDLFSLFETRAALSDFGFTSINVSHGHIWLAGNNGIAHFNPNKKSWTSYTQLQYQLDAHYFDIAFTDVVVWFATDKGLLKYNTKRDFWYRYTTEDGLAGNRVNHIDTAGDYLWLSTDAGITIFHWYSEDRSE